MAAIFSQPLSLTDCLATARSYRQVAPAIASRIKRITERMGMKKCLIRDDFILTRGESDLSDKLGQFWLVVYTLSSAMYFNMEMTMSAARCTLGGSCDNIKATYESNCPPLGFSTLLED